MFKSLVILSTFSILLQTSLSFAAIYGNNDLIPMFKAPASSQPLAASTAVMVPKNFAVRQGNNYHLTYYKLSESVYLCSSESMAKYQAALYTCTGFLIAPDLMVTAGHCLVNHGEATNTVTPQCNDWVWVFDNQFTPAMKLNAFAPAENVYECESVIKAVHNSVPNEHGPQAFNEDYALIRLKRPANRPLLSFASTPAVKNDPLSFIGYPLGTGLMYGTGKVLSTPVGAQYFRTNLDALDGHSGSPVFNTRNEVLGILVRGYPETLIEFSQPDCNVINRCDEEATRCTQNDPYEKAGEHIQILNKELIQKLLQ